MNWKEISEQSPKAFNVLEKWIADNFFDLQDTDRNLYDFFDENGIWITITSDYPPAWDNYKPITGDVFFWININWVWEDDIHYNTRTEAEIAAFTKAFEILEGKL